MELVHDKSTQLNMNSKLLIVCELINRYHEHAKSLWH